MLLSHRGITLKAPRGLGEQFRGHGEVYLGPGHMDMTKIGRQQGQSRFHIDTLAVPGDDTVDGHGVPEVMEAGLPPIRRRSPNAGMLPQTPKDFFKLLAGDGVATSRGKKSGARAGGLGQGLPCLAVGPKRLAQILSNGDDARLKEFGIPDREKAFAEVDITAPQPEPFAGTEPRSIQEEEQRTIRQGLQGKSCRGQGHRRLQQALEFLVRGDVRLECVCGAWARLLQWGGEKIPSAHQVGEEAAERLVFILPEAGRRTRAAAKGGTRFSGNGVERYLAQGPPKSTQNRFLRLQAGPQGPFERQISVDGTGECHANPPKFSKATRRKAVRLTLT